MHVLIVGGSGYLGQWLIYALVRQGMKVSYTYHKHPLPDEPRVRGFRVDLPSGDGLAAALTAAGPVHAVVNCAAISLPGECQKDYSAACAINVPRSLVVAMQQAAGPRNAEAAVGSLPLLVHLSTDQVYDGSRALWAEGDDAAPVNAYGRSKLQAEELVASSWPNHVLLRSSIICGPEPPFLPLGRLPFLQFLDTKLGAGEALSCFHDEYRNPIFVQDIVGIVQRLLDGQAAGRAPPHHLYNMGGPERLSRVDMAQVVAAHRGYDAGLIQSVSTGSVDRGFSSPPDISMKVSRLLSDFPGLVLTPFAQGVQELFPL